MMFILIVSLCKLLPFTKNMHILVPGYFLPLVIKIHFSACVKAPDSSLAIL